MPPRPGGLGRLEPAALAGVLVLGGILRFAFLSSRGLIYWDEAKFALEGVRMQLAWQSMLGSAVSLAGKPVGTAKPGHALLIALTYAIFGVHDYAPLILNAAASLFCLALLYVIARQLFGAPTALLAALLLAVSEYEIVYARSALSESDGTLFLLAGIAILLVGLRTGRIAAAATAGGLLLGIAFSVNYRLIVYIAVALVVLGAWLWRDCGRFPWRALILLPLLGVPPLLWQIIGIIARTHGVTLFANELTGRPTSYFAEVIYQLHEGKQSVLHFEPVLYLQWYLLRQGWPASLLLLAGLALVAIRRSPAWLLPAALVLVPYAIYVFAPFNVPRNLEAAVPFASILAAAAAVTLISMIRRSSLQPVLLLSFAALLAVLGSLLSWRLTSVRSGFVPAAEFIQQYAAGRTLTTSELMAFYLRADRTCTAPPMPLTRASLAASIDNGYHYAVTERHGTPLTYYVDTHAPVASRFPAEGRTQLGESLISSENGEPPRTPRHPEYVTIYRLQGLRLPAPGRAVTCHPNKVV